MQEVKEKHKNWRDWKTHLKTEHTTNYNKRQIENSVNDLLAHSRSSWLRTEEQTRRAARWRCHEAWCQHSTFQPETWPSHFNESDLKQFCFTNLEPHVKQHLTDDVEGFCEKIDDTGNGVPDDSQTVVWNHSWIGLLQNKHPYVAENRCDNNTERYSKIIELLQSASCKSFCFVKRLTPSKADWWRGASFYPCRVYWDTRDETIHVKRIEWLNTIVRVCKICGNN